jgi:uncharacterized SAM-binding protein YcdF (DUF218 family)
LFLGLGALAVGFAGHGFVLSGLGDALVRSEQPASADAIVVLAGDSRGYRITKACELLQAGHAPVALISGPMDIYGKNEADLAIGYAVARGCPAQKLEAVVIDALSTDEEADEFAPVLQRRGVHSLLLVTSNYHTARAGRIFAGRLGSGVQVKVVAAPDKYFTPDGWWKNREGRKTAFFEFTKTVAGWAGL